MYDRVQYILILDKFAIFDGYSIFNSQTVYVLLDCITDSYDINKQMAFDLLAACPTSIEPFQVWSPSTLLNFFSWISAAILLMAHKTKFSIIIALMQVFAYAIVFTNEPHFNTIYEVWW